MHSRQVWNVSIVRWHAAVKYAQIGEHSFSSLNIVHRLLLRSWSRCNGPKSNHVERTAEGPTFRHVLLDIDVIGPQCLACQSYAPNDLLNGRLVDKVV